MKERANESHVQRRKWKTKRRTYYTIYTIYIYIGGGGKTRNVGDLAAIGREFHSSANQEGGAGHDQLFVHRGVMRKKRSKKVHYNPFPGRIEILFLSPTSEFHAPNSLILSSSSCQTRRLSNASVSNFVSFLKLENGKYRGGGGGTDFRRKGSAIYRPNWTPWQEDSDRVGGGACESVQNHHFRSWTQPIYRSSRRRVYVFSYFHVSSSNNGGTTRTTTTATTTRTRNKNNKKKKKKKKIRIVSRSQTEGDRRLIYTRRLIRPEKKKKKGKKKTRGDK